MYRDFKTINDEIGVSSLGVRVYGKYCVVVERKPGRSAWIEVGERYKLRLPEGFDDLQTNPTSKLAISFAWYERDSPGSGLRELLT